MSVSAAPRFSGQHSRGVSLIRFRAAPNIRVIVNNNTNERMTGTAETKFNGSEWVTSIMIDALATNRNGMRDVIKGAV